MPTTTKDRNRTAYYRPHGAYNSDRHSVQRAYANSSTAHEIPPAYPQRDKADVRVKKQEQETSAKVNTAIQSKQRLVRVTLIAVVALVLCFTAIYRQNVILESNQKISKLEGELTAIMAANQAMQAKLDISVEMGGLEKRAREELGMMSPDSSQIFYIDMHMEDEGGNGSIQKDAAGAVTGTPGALVNAFRVLK